MKLGSVDEMAAFVVHLGFTPADYYQLTIRERNAILAEWNKTRAESARTRPPRR